MSEQLEFLCRGKRINALEREIKDFWGNLRVVQSCPILKASISPSSCSMEQLKIGYHYSKDNNG